MVEVFLFIDSLNDRQTKYQKNKRPSLLPQEFLKSQHFSVPLFFNFSSID